MDSLDATAEAAALITSIARMTSVTSDEAITGLKVLSEAIERVEREQGRIEMQTIWFWERTRYEREGWLVRHPMGGFDPCLRPLALRFVHD